MRTLPLVTGHGAPLLTDLEGLRPYMRSTDVIAIGARSNDPYQAEVLAAG